MNQLFPIFLKLDQLNSVLVGAGPIGLEKLQAILANAPNAAVKVIALEISADFEVFVANKPNIQVHHRAFVEHDLEAADVVFLATNNPSFNESVRLLTKEKHLLLNVADKPALCDFYLGSVVQKGNLKIGISTNGKSPTIAKRIKELLQDLLPEEIDETLNLMASLRNQLQGDFKEKVNVLNAHTAQLINKHEQNRSN